jgi:hypothetical protein
MALSDVDESVTELSWSSTGDRLTGVTKGGTACQWEIRPELQAEPSWTLWRQQALAAANRGDLQAVPDHCRRIRDWAGTDARDALDARQRLRALAKTADLLQRHHLLADAIGTNLQIVSFNVAQLPIDRLNEMPMAAVAARRIDELVGRLLSGAEIPLEFRRSELERLLDLLFPYGRAEAPIPFRAHSADSVATTWQVPQIVVELARGIGELERLRSEWDRHPWAEGMSLLALRAEASAAAGDTATTTKLVQQLTALEQSEQLPLWSEACILAPLRCRLTRVHQGFDDFSVQDNAGDHVQKHSDELHITAPVNGGELLRLGAVRRQPIQGDFEISVRFQLNDTQSPVRVAGLYLQLDLLEGGEVLHFGRVLSRDLGHELVAYQSQVTRSEDFFARMWRFPTDLRTGQLILARSGGVMYWFLTLLPAWSSELDVAAANDEAPGRASYD